MPTHLWHFDVTDTARDQISSLTAKNRSLIFDAIRQLLLVENPLSAPQVKKLLGKEYEGLYRKRQGDYRIFFSVDSSPIEFNKHFYKGTILIHEVRHRGSAYD